MSTTTPQDATPEPGPWVSKSTGLPAQLVRVEGNTCWYTIEAMAFEQPIVMCKWLESMRPAP